MDLMTASKRDFSRLGWALLIMAATGTGAQFLLGMLYGVLGVVSPSIAESPVFFWLMNLLPIYCIAMPLGWLVMRKIPVDPVQTTKMPAKHFGVLMLICIPILYVGNLIGTLLSMLFSGGMAENALVDLVFDNPVFTAFLAVIVAPLAEEFIFRKQIIDRVGRYGEVTGILVSALAFGLYHMNLFQFFYAFGLGILLAYTYTRTRMLRYSVIMHMIINFMGTVLAPMILMNVDLEVLDALSMGTADMDAVIATLPALLLYMGYASMLILLSIAGFVMLLLRWKKRVIFPTPAELPAGSRARIALGNVGMILFILVCMIFIVLALL